VPRQRYNKLDRDSDWEKRWDGFMADIVAADVTRSSIYKVTSGIIKDSEKKIHICW